MQPIEREAIILNTAWQMIDSMVNRAVFAWPDRIEDVELLFSTREAALLVNILLADFLSQVTSFKRGAVPLGLSQPPSNTHPSNLTFLFHLREVCTDPRLGRDSSRLSDSVEKFADWLEASFTAPNVNLAEIGVVTDITLTRLDYIKLCGDFAKHSLPRLEGDVAKLQKILKTSGQTVTMAEAYLAMQSFFDWFHKDIFLYHASMIAEHLNTIRWDIFAYLKDEYQRSWTFVSDDGTGLVQYRYDYPVGLSDPIAQAMYWDLMNRVRGKPLMPLFQSSKIMKSRH